MRADLRLQSPGQLTGHLLEALLDLAATAERGGGIFAFASADGIRALLADDAFLRLLRDGEFTLVAGVDAVTNERAIDALIAASEAHESLTIRVLIHDQNVLFHPKLSWFRGGDTLTLVVGSGNLTVRGLRENWEAFTLVELSDPAAAETEDQLKGWLAEHDPVLYAPDHARVREVAKLNTGRERELKHPKPKPPSERDPIPGDAAVLVAEAPKSGSRPSQVNFHIKHYEGFFGAKAGSGRRVILRSVGALGELGDEEIRPSSARMSRNYSFELAAFRTTDPPPQHPIIGLYVRLPQGTFLYQRIAPGESGYLELSAYLASAWDGAAAQKRQVVASVDEVKTAWPDSPLWTAEVPSA